MQPLVLDGFAYARFGTRRSGTRGSVGGGSSRRLGFQQGAWQQLIEVYRADGRDDEATRAAIAMHNDRVKRAGLPWYRRGAAGAPGHRRPWLPALACGHLGGRDHRRLRPRRLEWSGMFVPEQGVTGSPQPVAYAADTFLPIVDLGQADDWMPTGWVRWVDWSVILLGWALSTIFVAGFTRIVRTV